MMNRRNFLAASGAMLVLPQLESFSAEKNNKVNKKMVFLGTGFGFTESLYPSGFGKDYKLSKSMSPLQKHKNDLTIVSNLWHKFSRDPHGGCTSYLTGANVDGTPGKRFANTISCDQVAAKYLGKETRYSSLQITSTDTNSFSGYGKGLSLSWDANGKPISGVTEPFRLYDKLFGGGDMSYEEKLAMLQQRKSILDAFVSNLKSLKKRSSKIDQDKLEEYSQSIREIERSIAKEKMWSNKAKPKVNYANPGKDVDGEAEMKAMYEMIILALQTDSTRVISYRQPIKGLLNSLGLNYDGHQLSHYNGSDPRTVASEKKDLKVMELYSGFIDRLKAVKEVDGSRLFDNCLVSFGSNLRSGHMLKNVPAFLTGNIGGQIKHGRHIEMPKESALCNLWLTMLKLCDVPVEKFGDSDSQIKELFNA
ncbi:MAG: DUF1552 domain-containing protein [Lentisphaeraceae bacterium]|nr:DUF1552 domain-containing protein [Lentisphaeraceae bacterium]